MSFRVSKSILSESTGAYVAGVWVPGTRTTGTIQASVQPVVQGQDMQALPEGRRWSDFVKVYTVTKLKTTEDGQGVQPDYVVHEGFAYEVVSKFPYRSGVIDHYKYQAVKAFPISSLSAWTNGSIVRP